MNTVRRLIWSSAAQTHVGMVRKINEDACLALPEKGLWAVADGMGGHEAGDFASNLIVEALKQIPPPTDWEPHLAAVKECLLESNRRLRAESASHYQRRTIGSTVVVLLAHEDRCACLWVGDSRIYRLRNGSLRQLTRDHSHVQELVDQGLIQPQEAQHHPMSNVITRAVGSDDELDIDVLTLPLEPGDVYLLCSDGLNRVVSDEEIARLLNHSDDNEIVKTLIHLALVRNVNDNVTVVVVKVAEDLEP